MQSDIDEASLAQAEAFRSHPLIPDDVPVSSFIYDRHQVRDVASVDREAAYLPIGR